jgi:hypothetical protein
MNESLVDQSGRAIVTRLRDALPGFGSRPGQDICPLAAYIFK